jgi:DNA cross-link repair 1A protein
MDKLLVVPMNTPTLVDGVTLTLVDANHCPGMSESRCQGLNTQQIAAPHVSFTMCLALSCLLLAGAAMVIAQAPGQRPVLHTGDCRLAGHMMQVPDLQALRGKGACLVLDTTYCDAQVGY